TLSAEKVCAGRNFCDYRGFLGFPMYGMMSNRGRGYTTASLLLAFSLNVAGVSPKPRVLGARTMLTHSVTPVVSGAGTLSLAGMVGQVQQALQVNFGRVTVANKTYSSALTAPSVPDVIEPLIIGINGLQPHIQAHTNSHRVPVQSARVASRPIPLSPDMANHP